MKMKISDICVVSAGQGAPQGDSNYSEIGTPFVKAGNLVELLSGKTENEIQKVSEAVAKSHKLKKYPAGSILFAKSGMSCMKGYVYKLNNDAYVVSHLAILTPKSVNSDYLNFCLRHIKPNTLVKDAAYPSISLEDISNLEIPVPSEEKQNEIATALNQVTKVIKEHEKLLENYDILIKSRFIEMFGDPISNPMGWEVKQLSEYITFLTSGSRGWSEYFSNKGELFLTIKNVKNNKITIDNIQYVEAPRNKEAERTRVQEGDLLISITADLGRTGVVSKEIASAGAYINQHLSLVRLDKNKVNPLFVSFYLETDGGKLQFSKKNQSAVKAGLNFDAIKSLNFYNPPLKKQNEFIAFVQQIDKSKFEIWRYINFNVIIKYIGLDLYDKL